MKSNTFAAAVLMAAMATAAPLTLQKRAGTSYNGGDTASDITDGVCAPLTFLFARGSTEPGTMGSTVGPALAKQLISDYGAENVAVQGVDYPATIESNASLGSEGGPEMATLGKKAISQCPNTKLVLSGYSQGGLVTHYAVASAGLPATDVAAVVLYGDPEQKDSVGSVPAAKVKEFCASGDGVCETGGFDITAAHLSYTSNGDIGQGATFVKNTVGALGSASGTSSAPASNSSAPAAAAPSASASSASSPFGSLGGGLGSSTGSGLGGLASGFPGLGGSSGSGGLGGLGSLGGSSTGSGLGGLSSGIPSLGGSSGSSGLGGFGSLGGSSTGSGLGSLSSGIPSFGGGDSGSSLGGLGSLGGGSSSGLGSLGSLGGSGTSGGLGALSSGLPSLGSGESSGLGGLSGLEGGSGGLSSLGGGL